MKVAIIGYGVEGKISAEYWASKGHEITVLDQDAKLEIPANFKKRLGPDYLKELKEFDVIVRSAGVPPRLIGDNNPEVMDRVTTSVNEFLAACPSRKIIGVTGTKGKGTTCTLIAKMLEATGLTVHLGGNIGVAPLAMLETIKPDDWVVLELSSFQLIDLNQSPHLAVCLMVVPEHLNWHADVDEYIKAKSRLFAGQSSEDVAIYFAENSQSQEIASAGQGRKIPYFAPPGAVVENDIIKIDGQTICRTDELKLLGAHNWQNACAAVTAVWFAMVSPSVMSSGSNDEVEPQVTQNVKAIRSVLTSFSGLEHRLEFVREAQGVKYYDDSFGTTPETAIVAMQAFAQPKVVILGGSDKGASYDELARVVTSSNVRQAVLIGDQAARIQQALEAAGFRSFTLGGETMPQIVRTAKTAARPGDVVLLSTACASFGLFKDYKDRGNQFKQVVNTL